MLNNLLPYNTFAIQAKAKAIVPIKQVNDISKAYSKFEYDKKYILGGGSNILLTQDLDGVVLLNNLKGIKILKENESHVWIKAESGESWHGLVLWSIQHGFGGIENLSLIPGTVGAAPIQNIGAYGVELADVLENVDAVDIRYNDTLQFTKQECSLGYRNSIFKNETYKNYFITSITLKLTKNNHVLKMEYGDIKSTLEQMMCYKPTIKDISKAIIKIRQSKLPDPEELGNAGSFFKNTFVSKEKASEMLSKNPLMPSFSNNDDELVKIPSAWLIEQCGWKGKRIGDAGVHQQQALVIVNYGKATGKEILNLVYQIQNSVKEKFNIDLQPEVNIW